MTENLSFSDRLAKLRADRGRSVYGDIPDTKPKEEFDEDLIPDILPERTEEDQEIDRIINSIPILDAYDKWCGGKRQEPRGRTEGIKCQCPVPGHKDENPSMWVNTDKNTWNCGRCEMGGDAYDLAAWKFGYPVPGYKDDGKMFHELREQMAEDFGYRVQKVAGTTIVYKPEEESESNEDVQPAAHVQHNPHNDEKSDNISQMWATSDEEENIVMDALYPTIEWKELIPEDTFLYEYCKATSNDDSPEEYHFWHGLLALAHAVGRNIYLDDTKPVYGNMLTCLLGGTGYGKSRSRHWLDEVIEKACPFKDTGMGTEGVKIAPVPASGESLIKIFSYQTNDPNLPKGSARPFMPVNAIVDFDEFSALLARANRQGNTLKPIIMSMADARNKVSTSSITSGDYYAEMPFCSITASTQPKAIRTLLNKTDAGSGFLNRWVFIGGPRKKREVIGGTRSTIRVDLGPAINLLKSIRAWGAKERPVYFDDDAFRELETFFRVSIFPAQDKDESDLLKRLDLLFKRIILLFCINEKKTTVDIEVVRRAESLLDYIVKCYEIINSEIGVTFMSELTTEIMRHIKRHKESTGRGATARDLIKYMARKNYSPDMIRKAIETMVALDWIEVVKPSKSTPGRPTIRYEAVS